MLSTLNKIDLPVRILNVDFTLPGEGAQKGRTISFNQDIDMRVRVIKSRKAIMNKAIIDSQHDK